MKHAHSLKLVTPDELQQWLADDKQFLLIDTLPPDHFVGVHLPGARNACVLEMTFLEQVAAFCHDSSETIVVYGSSSNSLDGLTAAEKLTMAGYSDITMLEGGIDRWRQAGYPLTGATPSADRDGQRLLDGKYAIVIAESSIGWTGRSTTTRHYGTVDISGGQFVITDTAIQGSLTVNMDSITNINLAGDELQQVLVSHLRSDDFFLVDAFPAARLDIRGGRMVHEDYPTQPNCEITATLDLRGVQSDLTFKAVVARGQDDHLHLAASFDLDRTLWGITYGSSKFYEHLGMHTVFDHISIELQVVAEKTE